MATHEVVLSHDQVIEALYAADGYDPVTDTHAHRDMPEWLLATLKRVEQSFREHHSDFITLSCSTERHDDT